MESYRTGYFLFVKKLRGNAITGTVCVIVLSSVDVVNIFRRRISGTQLSKNVVSTTSTVAGGTACWVGGATARAAVGSFVLIIGTVVGRLLGSVAAGSSGSKVLNAVLSEFIEDDQDEMVSIIEKVFTQMVEDYFLGQKEAENIMDNLKHSLTGPTLKGMFASSSSKKFPQELLIDHGES